MKSLVKLSIIIFCIAYSKAVGMEYKPTEKIENPQILITSIENQSDHVVAIVDKDERKKILELAPKRPAENVAIQFTKKGSGTFKKNIAIVNKEAPDSLIKFMSKINVPKKKMEYSIEPKYFNIVPTSIPIHTLELSNTYLMTIKISNGPNKNEIRATITVTAKK